MLPNIDLTIPSLIWLDYDGVLKNYMFEDLEIIFHTIPAGSIFIMSCNRELKKGNYVELQEQIIDYNDGQNPMSPDEIKEALRSVETLATPEELEQGKELF